MMVELLPASESIAHRVVESVLASLPAGDPTHPPMIAVDDGTGRWREHAAARPVGERRRSVIASASEASLIDAVLFEIGGALWIPVSAAAMVSAFETSSSTGGSSGTPLATRGVLESLTTGCESVSAVGWRPSGFWHRQVGEPRLRAWLTAIADGLGGRSAMLAGPTLLVADRSAEEIERVLRGDLMSGFSGTLRPPFVEDLTSALRDANPPDRVDAVVARVVEASRRAGRCPGSSAPVLELPSGGRVGSWAPSEPVEGRDGLWLATPTVEGAWRLAGGDAEPETVVESVLPDDPIDSDQRVVRLPGFVGAALRRAGPAGLLVERWANHPNRRGRPIWVPSVDAEGVRFLLELPGPFWVDGPGVPGD